jgi:hypothetical protein
MILDANSKNPAMAKTYQIRTLTTLVLFTFFAATMIAQKTQLEHQPASALKGGAKKQTSATTSARRSKVTNDVTRDPNTNVALEDRRTNERYKDGQGKKPVVSSSNGISSQNDALPVINLEMMRVDSLTVRNPNIENFEEAGRENHLCGCRSEILMVNASKDTLDLRFLYINKGQELVYRNRDIPNRRRNAQRRRKIRPVEYPIAEMRGNRQFYLAPGDSTRMQSFCEGILQYEATGRSSEKRKQGSKTSYLNAVGHIRPSCAPQTIIFRDDR